MRMHLVVGWMLLASVWLASSAQATSALPQGGQGHAPPGLHGGGPLPATGLRDLAVAVLLDPAPEPAGAAPLLAQVASSQDPVGLQLAVQAGRRMKAPALVHAAAARWQALEPDNLAPALLAMDGDPAPVLAGAARFTRDQAGGFQVLVPLRQALARMPRMADAPSWPAGIDQDTATLVQALAIWSAFATPQLASLVSACTQGAPDATRQEACLHLGQVMAQTSDTLIEQAIGTAVWRRAATGNPTQEQAATAWRRDLDWRWQQLAGLDQGAQSMAEIGMVLASDPSIGEVGLLERRLQLNGVAVSPPAGWVSPRPR